MCTKEAEGQREENLGKAMQLVLERYNTAPTLYAVKHWDKQSYRKGLRYAVEALRRYGCIKDYDLERGTYTI